MGHSHLKRPISLLLIDVNKTKKKHVFLFWYSYVHTTYLSWRLKLYRQSLLMYAHVNFDVIFVVKENLRFLDFMQKIV